MGLEASVCLSNLSQLNRLTYDLKAKKNHFCPFVCKHRAYVDNLMDAASAFNSEVVSIEVHNVADLNSFILNSAINHKYKPVSYHITEFYVS